MNKFLPAERTWITPLLLAQTEDALLAEIRACIQQGATAFGFMIERLPQELRSPEKMRMFFSEMGDRPIYVTCYLRGDVMEETDDERAEYLLQALECGATMADVRGDMFAPCDGEMTFDEVAVAKQKALIKKIHGMGKEVLISSHIEFDPKRTLLPCIEYDKKWDFLPYEDVLKIALEHQSRGADITKIVTNADTDEELAENFKTYFRVKEQLDISFLFLCNGKKCLPHRLAGPLIGEPMVFVREASCVSGPKSAQPSIAVIKELMEKF
jgi:3-dehydroquinate dehydratase